MKAILQEYITFCREKSVYPHTATGNQEIKKYLFMGLVGEFGECVDHIKKSYRDNNGELTLERRQALLLELGDMGWYLARMFDECGLLNNYTRLSVEDPFVPSSDIFDKIVVCKRRLAGLGSSIRYYMSTETILADLDEVFSTWAGFLAHFGYSVEEVIKANMAKLTERAKNDRIRGQGSDR